MEGTHETVSPGGAADRGAGRRLRHRRGLAVARLGRPPRRHAEPLGDLSGYQTIVSDTQQLVDAGDLAAAETRITDFETKWDDAESTLRPKAPAAWGNVDAAADNVFAALRARNPTRRGEEALAALSDVLADPAGARRRRAAWSVSPASPSPTPTATRSPASRCWPSCARALSDGSVSREQQAKAADLQAKATERCNADDDTHADAFAAQALALAHH